MSKFMKVSRGLSTVVDDEEAPVRLRYQALQLMTPPSLGLMKPVTRIIQTAGLPNSSRLASAAVSYLIQQGSFPPLELRKPTTGPENTPDRAGIDLGAKPD
jgi:hypothetical protein